MPSARVKQAATVTAITAAIIAFTSPFEGTRTVAYRDPVGVWTICMGETKGVTPGMRKTKQQCISEMAARVPDYLGPVDRLMPALPDNRRIAYTDAAWNLGTGVLTRRATVIRTVGGVRKASPLPGSSIAELEQAGMWKEACNRLLLFNKAGSPPRVLPGLDKRRKEENKLCLNG